MHGNSRGSLLALLAFGIFALTGCGTSTSVTPPCCYQGEVVTARLSDLDVQLEDGRLLPFGDVFTGFAPEEGAFTRSLPLTDLIASDLYYASLAPLLPLYDANGDRRLEEPEILVLYAREAALASGIPMHHFGAPPGVWALATANADVAGLITWTEARYAQMSPRQRQLFYDLERLGLDKRNSMGELGGDGDRKRFSR